MSAPTPTTGPSTSGRPLVSVATFARAESDRYFAEFVARAGLGVLAHRRAPADVAHQDVVRMNRDTLYSTGVFDLDAGPVTLTLPDAGGRFMSLQPVSQDHYTTGAVYAPGRFTFTAEGVGTRYVALIIRTFVDPDDPADVTAAHAAQDAITVEQDGPGTFQVPAWDPATLDAVRDTLLHLAPALAERPGAGFGTAEQVDPIRHLLVTAGGWGGNKPEDALYVQGFPEHDDGTTPYLLRVADVPVDGFWSVSVYNADGYFQPNPEGRYSVNDVTAQADPDGPVTIHFGGTPDTPNRVPITPGWNYVARLYRPRPELLDGTWTFPDAHPTT